MTISRLYADENFPRQVVEELRALGHDVLTIQETGKADQALPDSEVLAFAAADQRAVLTLNRKHFIKLHQTHDHAGIIACTVDLSFHAQARRIDLAIREAESLTGKLIRVNRPQS